MQTKEWFENWFDSVYYPILYNNRDTNEAALFVDNLMNYLQPPVPSRVLDIACGEGRFAKQLESYGHRVIGIDLSAKRIANAQQWSSEHLSFYVHDMRLPFYTNYFDFAFNFFTSFGYFNTNRDHHLAAHSFSSALKPGGTLVIDYFNINNVVSQLVKEEIVERENIKFHISRNVEGDKIVKHIRFKNINGEMQYYKEKVCAFGLDDFIGLFTNNGMMLNKTFGDYHLNPFDEENSERLIMIFKKY